MSEDTDFCNLGETYQTNLEDNYWRLLQKQGLMQKQTHKAAEATGEFIGIKL